MKVISAQQMLLLDTETGCIWSVPSFGVSFLVGRVAAA